MTTPVLRDRLAALLAPRYILDRELAGGGMALVFLGHDPALGRDVAIKLLPPEQATAVARERFLREARLLAQLAHPHVVPILEVQEQEGLLWFVMPHIEGDALSHRIGNGALPLREVQRIGIELLDALAFAHSHGVIHRDVKPANVFLQGNHALLADFGVAQLRHPDEDTLTEAGRLLGTLRYMTPEQLTGAAATARSDLYSLGATLYEAVAGRQWSPALHPVAATWQGIEPRFAAVLRRALEPIPERRWPDAASFRTALEHAGGRRVSRLAMATGIVAVTTAVALTVFVRPSTVPVRRYDLAVRQFGGVDSATASSLTKFTTNVLEGFPQLTVMPWPYAFDPASGPRHPSATFNVYVTFESGASGAGFSVEVRSDGADVLGRFFLASSAAAEPQALGAAIADSLVRQLYPKALTEFRQWNLCKSGQRRPNVWQAYWEGEVAFQQSRWEAAERAFRKAWRLDTTFATAQWYYNLSQQFRRVASDSDLTELARHSDRLCAPLGKLVRFQVEPDLEVRMAGYKALARDDQEYPPVRLLLANELFHRGPLIGRPLQEGVDTFWNSAIQLADLDQATTYMQVIWGALRIGNESMAREALSRRAAVTSDEYSRFLRLATEGRFRPWLARPLLAVTFWFADSEFVAEAGRLARVGLEVDAPHEQLAVGRLLASAKHGATDRRRASGFAAEATALLLLGRPIEALRQLDSGAALPRSGPSYQLQPWEWRVLLPIAGMPIPKDEIATGRRVLAAVAPTDPRWPRAVWALILDADQRRDVAVRDQLRTALRARGPGDSVAEHLARFADAIALGTDGLVDSALALSRAIHREPSDSMGAWRGPLVRALVYLKRGEWQLARGNLPGANLEWLWHENNDFRGWPDGEPQEGELDAALSALVRLKRAANFAALDERHRLACPLYTRVRELWRHAESSFDGLRKAVQKEVDQCRT